MFLKNLSLKLIFLSLAVQLFVFVATASGALSNLVLFPEKGVEAVELPFEYKHLTPEDHPHVTWVPQGFYTVIEPGTKKLALAGTLRPCLLVALKNNTSGRIIVFHKHRSNSMSALIEIARQELGPVANNDINGIIFTTTPADMSEAKIRFAHNGKTLNEEVRHVKDCIIEGFGLKDRSRVNAKVYTSHRENFELGDYEMAEISVILGTDFKPYSICMMHENIFGEINISNRLHRILTFNERLTAKIYKAIDKIIRLFGQRFNIYEAVPPLKIEGTIPYKRTSTPPTKTAGIGPRKRSKADEETDVKPETICPLIYLSNEQLINIVSLAIAKSTKQSALDVLRLVHQFSRINHRFRIMLSNLRHRMPINAQIAALEHTTDGAFKLTLESDAVTVAAALGNKDLLTICNTNDLHFSNGISAAHFAAYYDQQETLEALIRKNPQYINLMDERHRTPLMIAAQRGHINCVKTLAREKRNLIQLANLAGLSQENSTTNHTANVAQQQEFAHKLAILDQLQTAADAGDPELTQGILTSLQNPELI